jgi:hypothetical protein
MDPLLFEPMQAVTVQSPFNANLLWKAGEYQSGMGSRVNINLNDGLVQRLYISGRPWFKTGRTEDGVLEAMYGIKDVIICPGDNDIPNRYLVKNVSVTLQPHFVDIPVDLGRKTVSIVPRPISNPMTPVNIENLTSALTMSATPSATVGYSTARQIGTGPYLHFRSDAGTGKFKWIIDTHEFVRHEWPGLSGVDFGVYIRHEEARLESIDFIIEQDLYSSGNWFHKLFLLRSKNRKLRQTLKITAFNPEMLTGLRHNILHDFSISDREYPSIRRVLPETSSSNDSQVIMVSQLTPR